MPRTTSRRTTSGRLPSCRLLASTDGRPRAGRRPWRPRRKPMPGIAVWVHNSLFKRGHAMNVDDFRQLYVTELQELRSVEDQLVQALPRMIEAAQNPQLKQAIETHL